MAASKIFEPFQIGRVQIENRILRSSLQLSYSGRQQDNPGIENWHRRPLAPTSQGDYFQGIRGRAMSQAEIKAMVARFVAAAHRVQKAGLDGIELHSGNGYLFTQFLSGAINDRTDEYGGSLSNRFRFLEEVMAGLRNDSDLRRLPLIVKLSGLDHHNAIYPWKPLGTPISESVQIAQWAEARGADAIHVSTGSMFPHPWNPAGYMPTDIAKRTYGGIVDSGSKTLLIYLGFRFFGPLVRLVWERSLRKKLYHNFGDYIRGRQRDDPPAWALIEGINRAAARAIKQKGQDPRALHRRVSVAPRDRGRIHAAPGPRRDRSVERLRCGDDCTPACRQPRSAAQTQKSY